MARFLPDDDIKCTECDNQFTLKEASKTGDSLDEECPNCGADKEKFRLA